MTQSPTPVAQADILRDALIRLLRSFPTDTDMLEAGWVQADIDEACNAYDAAKAALSSTPVAQAELTDIRERLARELMGWAEWINPDKRSATPPPRPILTVMRECVAALSSAPVAQADILRGALKQIVSHPNNDAFASQEMREIAIAALSSTPVAPAGGVHVAQCRECSACGHVGINDPHERDAACSHCDWSGPSPEEDHCPECGEDGTMTAACPKCSGRYRLIAETEVPALATPAAPAVLLTDERIVEIRDEHLPSQGESFDCIAYARDIESEVRKSAPVAPAPDYSEMSREQLERHTVRLAQASEHALAFWHKHGCGPLAMPSCLCCGKLPEVVAIKHMELPAVVICQRCRDAALSAAAPVAPAVPTSEQILALLPRFGIYPDDDDELLKFSRAVLALAAPVVPAALVRLANKLIDSALDSDASGRPDGGLADDALRLRALLAAPVVPVEPAAPGWIDFDDRRPAVGQRCLIWSQEPWEKTPSVKQDRWDEQHEAPLPWSSATVPIGEGWDNDSACVTHWMPEPEGPAAALAALVELPCQDLGVAPAGPGSHGFATEPQGVSAVPVSIPNAGERGR